MADQVRVFVSHHHSPDEDTFTARLVADLEAAGADVWVDDQRITSDDFIKKINEGLTGRQWLVLVMTPDALHSEWVGAEVNAALNQVRKKRMLGVIPIVANLCDDADIPPLWDTLHRYDATRDYTAALAGVIRSIGLSPAVASATSHISTERFPPQLTQLGFVGLVIDGVEVIVPPICDVPVGEFLMGSDSAQDRRAAADEKPQKMVPLQTFQIARFPVTVAEYACFVRTGHAEPLASGLATWDLQLQRLDHPVVCISWYDAKAYAAWLARQTSKLWRLPTEAEWEKAARWDSAANKSRIFPWGDSFDQVRCNTAGAGKGMTTPVGAYPTGGSPCGAQDMAGNVWERTGSIYMPYPYNAEDGRERVDSTEHRVLRGGSWSGTLRSSRAAARVHDHPQFFRDNAGFRLALTAPDA